MDRTPGKISSRLDAHTYSMDQRPHLHGERGSSLPLLPIHRLPKASDGGSLTRRVKPRREDYTIAWICALRKEFKAAHPMLDEVYESLTIAGDENLYVLGGIGVHKVVMVAPIEEAGTIRAAIVATNLKRSFTGIRATFIVGIAGGAPSSMSDIRLGDVIVGMSVMQYDLGKHTTDEQFQVTGPVKRPAPRLAAAVSVFSTKHDVHSCGEKILEILQSQLPNLSRPSHPDNLFQTSYDHHPRNAPTCDDCDPESVLLRTPRSTNIPEIFYGGIGSGNSVIRNARKRDEMAAQHKFLCFEMEAAGLMDALPIRGICDYADSHKNKEWHDYAAATAAAYTRLFLQDMPAELGSKDTFGLGRIARSAVKYAHQTWLRSPRFRWLIRSSLVLLVAAVIVVPTVLASLAKKAAAQYVQRLILP